MNYGFPPQARVRTPCEFERVFQRGQRVATPRLALHWLAVGNVSRLGVAVSRKVSTHAVVRNRIKRVAREVFRHLRPTLPAGDYVLVARRDLVGAVAALPGEVNLLLQRIGALPLAQATATMPTAATATLNAAAQSGR